MLRGAENQLGAAYSVADELVDRPVDFPQSGGFDLCLFAVFHLATAFSGWRAGFQVRDKGAAGAPFCPSSLTMATLGMTTNVNIDGPPPVSLTVPILVRVFMLETLQTGN